MYQDDYGQPHFEHPAYDELPRMRPALVRACGLAVLAILALLVAHCH